MNYIEKIREITYENNTTEHKIERIRERIEACAKMGYESLVVSRNDLNVDVIDYLKTEGFDIIKEDTFIPWRYEVSWRKEKEEGGGLMEF